MAHVARICAVALLGCAAVFSAAAAERFIDFTQFPPDQPLKGFRSTVSGEGNPGDWRIVLDTVPSQLATVLPNAQPPPKRAVLAQTRRNPADEHFPLLVYEEEKFGDFVLEAKFKTVEGVVEQMAGIAFRIRDERNYYVIRASSMGNTFRFYKFVDGQRTPPLGPEVPIPKGAWHSIKIDCKGNQIRGFLNGKEMFPTLTDNSFDQGFIGLWTKSDSVSHFADIRIVYTPIEILAKTILRELQGRYPRVIGMRIYAATPSNPELRIVASTHEKEIGQPANEIERDVVSKERIAYGKTEDQVLVTLPLHDRNGETVGAFRVALKPFPGQTEQNAIGRAIPILREVEKQSQTARKLTE